MTKTEAETLLGLKGEYSPQDVKTRYRKLSKLAHPDSNGDEDLFAIINEAYEILKDQSGFVKVKPKESSSKNKEPMSTREKVIASCGKIVFTVNELCSLASDHSVEKHIPYKGKMYKIEFTINDFIMNYYKNIYLVFDMKILLEEIAFFSKENSEINCSSLTILASENMIGQYSQTISSQRGRKLSLTFVVSGNETTATIERNEDRRVTILDYSISSNSHKTIRLKLIVTTKVVREWKTKKCTKQFCKVHFFIYKF